MSDDGSTVTLSGNLDVSGNIVGDVSGTANDANRLVREDNRVISPSELTAGRLKFGFTSYSNNNSGPWADFLHLRSYTDSSGGSDNLVMFKKSGIGMRIWQQTWGSSTAYASYVDVLDTGAGNQVKSGYIQSNNSLRAPIFYDSNNTGYYINPAATDYSGVFRQHVTIGDSAQYKPNSGNWGARLNVVDNVHAKITVGQDANDMLSVWYAHTGQSSIKFGTETSHNVEIIAGNATRLTIDTGGNIHTHQVHQVHQYSMI